MSAAALSEGVPLQWISGTRIGNRAIASLVFLSGFVIVEPSPYDLGLIATIVVWVTLGLKLNRHFLPLTVLLLFYLAGGLIGLTQAPAITGRSINYMITTGYLAASAIFFAGSTRSTSPVAIALWGMPS